jgi:hypothetical protein
MEDILVSMVDTDSNSITIQIKTPLSSKGMLPTEENIQRGMNRAGLLATQYALSQYDTDGSPIRYAGEKYTGKGYQPKICQCPSAKQQVFRQKLTGIGNMTLLLMYRKCPVSQ